VCSVSGGEGISAFDPADALFKRALIARSRAVMMMVATDKLGTRAPHRVAALDEIDGIVVEHDALMHADFAAMKRLDIPLVTAEPPA
jgi:DeoR/GlpR family transcriptional regulator of sugar metabolism